MKNEWVKIVLITTILLMISLIGYRIYSFYFDNQNTNISLQQNHLTLDVNEKVTLKVEGLENEKYHWQSSDPSVAIVNNNGEVIGLKKGTTTITVSKGNKKAYCLITVIDNNLQTILPESISFSDKQINLTVGDTQPLNYTINPSNMTNKTVTLTSSNSKVASVTNGIVEALSEGTSIITITTINGKQDTCIINVSSKKIEPTSISIESITSGLKIGSALNLKYSYEPSNATSSLIIFKSSNENVAIVDNNGKVIGKGLGETEIFATVNGKTLKSVKVKVIPQVDYIKINKLTPKMYKIGISFSNANTKEALIMQDFDIMNVGTSNEQYYFTMCYTGVTNSINKPTSDLIKKLKTAVIYKLNSSQLSNTKQGSIMYVDNAGQGQWIVKEPTGNYFWTSGNADVICSGTGCSYNNGYTCGDASKCRWWGGNNANVQRISFTKNSYGSSVTSSRSYNFGTINQKDISIFMALDSENDLMATIKKVGTNSKREVVVYKASDYKNGKKTIIYQFELGNNPKISSSVSYQGHALYGGYLYRLRGNYDKGMYIEVIDMYGNFVLTQEIDPGYKKKRQEAQGIKIYNNRIYFGFTYRPDCVWDNETNNCKSGTMWTINNAIYYMG